MPPIRNAFTFSLEGRCMRSRTRHNIEAINLKIAKAEATKRNRRTRLLSLPPELRNHIFALTFWDRSLNDVLPNLVVCKQIWQETSIPAYAHCLAALMLSPTLATSLTSPHTRIETEFRRIKTLFLRVPLRKRREIKTVVFRAVILKDFAPEVTQIWVVDRDEDDDGDGIGRVCRPFPGWMGDVGLLEYLDVEARADARHGRRASVRFLDRLWREEMRTIKWSRFAREEVGFKIRALKRVRPRVVKVKFKRVEQEFGDDFVNEDEEWGDEEENDDH
ncbi:hypothetical protein K402DRAFT_420356 [Aulographum hederae CBS 113979]|uniref:Uncharacterized protein n=1 Tax=Aulographum hederae CBS 113979 TaxID=1176131 RepID=A0A6G1H3L8_9PEZI|nr:hypothetical protein K402DRAFT_420356 [Aulographum hederae CBS 113979]